MVTLKIYITQCRTAHCNIFIQSIETNPIVIILVIFPFLPQIYIMELFYAHPTNISDTEITIDDFEGKHLTKTLRKKIGDPVDVTHGQGKHFSGVIKTLKPEVTVTITSVREIEKEKQILSLGIAFIRPNRLEFVLEKGTELGVDTFYLFRSEHANYFSNNEKRFEKILRQAIKQSNRFYLPRLFLIPNFKSFIQQTENHPYKIAAIDPKSPPLGSLPSTMDQKEILFCVGPEGGFSENEIGLVKESGFKDISLGNYRLRAETAAIAGLARIRL
jgi:16S rRNA (uracil1498-N3)-methyltransferase